MSPDIPYYVPVIVDASTTHSLLGSVGVDAVLGAVVFALWHGFLARPAFAAAPRGVRARLALPDGLRPRIDDWRLLLWTYLSLCIGSWTHVLWDDFTHAGRWGTTHVGWLQATHHGLRGYHWAQYASGVFGALVIAIELVRWWRRTPARQAGISNRGRIWLAWLVIAGAGAAAALLVDLTEPTGKSLSALGFRLVTRSLAAATAAALVLAGWWHVRPSRAADPSR